jgi:transcriptional regulator with XRE-family HTH domain
MTKGKGSRTAARKDLRRTAGGKTGLSQRIREMRMTLQLKQSELGDRLGVASQAVSQWERDKLPTIDNLRELARIGSTTLDWLLEGRDRFPERLAMMTDSELRIMRDYIETNAPNAGRA